MTQEEKEDFFFKIQNLICDRLIAPKEFINYLNILDTYKISTKFLLNVISLCVKRKGTKIGAPYILAVIENLLQDLPEDYIDFINNVARIIDREILDSELKSYYSFLESNHVGTNYLLKIIEFCVNRRSSLVGYKYILTVAQNWYSEGIKTESDVDLKIKSLQK